MSDNKNAQEAQVVDKKHPDTVALEALRTNVSSSKENFRKQLSEVKEAIESREADLKILQIKKNKLEGAIEASDLYLKPTAK